MRIKNVFAVLAMLSIGFVMSNCDDTDEPGVSDKTKPTVTQSEPTNNATGVQLNQAIVITFSEPMNPATISSTTYKVSQGSTEIAGAIVYTGTTATFTPTSSLSPSVPYVVTVTTGAKDMAGNALATTHTINFTTGATPDLVKPLVSSTDPNDLAVSVARNKVVSIVFSEAMNAATINGTNVFVKLGSNLVEGTVSYSGVTATFTSTAALLASVVYTATVTSGVSDVSGNTLAAPEVFSFTTGGNTSALSPVDLGAAGNYVILAKTAINNSSTSAVTGDLGLSPAATSFITGLALTNATGFATSAQVTGNIYAADMADPTPINLTTAVNNMITAYNDAAARPTPDFLELNTGNIGGKTLTAGLYKWTSTVTMPSNVTISGGANDVWIFQISGDLSMSPAVRITLTGGAQAKNIFWQVAGQATLGTTSHFEGILLSMTGITLQTGGTMNGRALAQTAVILDSNAVTKPN